MIARGTIIAFVALIASACGGGQNGSGGPAASSTSSSVPDTSTTTMGTTTTTGPAEPEESTEPAAPDDPADLVIYGGPFITVDSDGRVVEAVAVDDGRFVAVGSTDEAMARAGADTSIVDLGGLTVMPGVVDPHVHYIQNQTPDLVAMAEDQRTLIENGRTTVGIPAVIAFNMDAFEAFDAADLEILRMHFYLGYNNSCGDLVGDYWRQFEFDRSADLRMAVAGVKLFTDGGACNSPAVSWEYPDSEAAAALGVTAGHGDLYVAVDEVAAVVSDTDTRGGLTVIHAVGDVGVEVALDGLAGALAGSGNGNRHRIDHNTVVNPAMYERYGELGVSPVVFGNFSSCREAAGQGWSAIQPAELLSWHRATPDLMAANPGLPVSFHSDVPHGWLNMFEQLWGLVTLSEVDHESGQICEPPSWLDGHGVPLQTALEMMTINAAHVMDLDGDVGSIEVGKIADMLVLANNPLAQSGDDLLDNAVMATVIDGLVVFCDPGAGEICDGIGRSPLGAGTGVIVNGGEPAGPTDAIPIVGIEASAVVPGFPVEGVRDGITDESGWVSGDFAPQWIELDLGTEVEIAELHLWVDQDPDGPTVHRILGGPDPAPTEELGRVSLETHRGQFLAVEIGQPARYLRIETVSSPSWVAWLEISVVGAS